MKYLMVGCVLVLVGLGGCSSQATNSPVADPVPAEPTAPRPEVPPAAETKGSDTASMESATPAGESATPAGETAKSDEQTAEASPTPPASASERTAAAPRRPTNGEAEQITFDDLNCGMQADIQFRPWMLTERVKELEGQKVRVAGYMHPDAKQKGIVEFILLRNTECKFGPAGQADHLVRVKLKEGVTTSYSISPVEVTGVLTINPFEGPDGNTWSIFDLEGEAVGTPRRGG